jgi:hypothetical protein
MSAYDRIISQQQSNKKKGKNHDRILTPMNDSDIS